jgi:hypothetical protein
VQNLLDLLDVRGVDLALAASDALIAGARKISDLPSRVQYIAKLYDQEVHVLGAPGIDTLEDLKGKRVNVDVIGSGTAMTANIIFHLLGLQVQQVNETPAKGVELLRKGDVSAVVYEIGKPGRLFLDGSFPAGSRLLPVPLSNGLEATYLPGRFTHADYPSLVPEGQSVDTIAVPVVLACYAWPRSSERYEKLSRFVAQFYASFAKLLQPPHHAKWKEVNLAAQIPNWTRFPAASELLARSASASQFETFLEEKKLNLSPEERRQIISEFLKTR